MNTLSDAGQRELEEFKRELILEDRFNTKSFKKARMTRELKQSLGMKIVL